ncbi:hypothetical protein F5Y13DRAFT_203893 [Hypoxylon sp. FL1857]|nr:hypothetical protein F5Y13DRAFT_203893 [Hypoxylon sp. FL1857]
MQFKLSMVLVVAPFMPAALAQGGLVDDMAAQTPTSIINSSSLAFNPTEWTALDDGWHFTGIYRDKSGDGHIARRSTPTDWFQAHWGSTTPVLVDNFKSRLVCFSTGARLADNIIRKNVDGACNAIINKVPDATIADNRWVLLKIMGITDASGEPAYLQFIFSVLNNDIKPTVQLCQSALYSLLGSECTQNKNSQGGLIAIGESFLVGFIPQDIKEQGHSATDG